MELASQLTLYGNTPLQDALNLPRTVIERFLSGRCYEDWMRGKEAEMKSQAAIVSRLNEVIKGLNGVAARIGRSAR